MSLHPPRVLFSFLSIFLSYCRPPPPPTLSFPCDSQACSVVIGHKQSPCASLPPSSPYTVTYGFLQSRLSPRDRPADATHAIWIERGLRAVDFTSDSEQVDVGGIKAEMFSMGRTAWGAAAGNSLVYGMTTEWDATHVPHGGTWPLSPSGGGAPSADTGGGAGLGMAGGLYSMPYAWAKPPHRLDIPSLTEFGATRRAPHTWPHAHHAALGPIQYNHRQSVIEQKAFTHAGTMNESYAMSPAWSVAVSCNDCQHFSAPLSLVVSLW